MKDLYLDIGGPVHVVDHGGEGPPMLLVHGLGGSLLDWLDVAPALAQRHHVWAVDLFGFGRTPLAGRGATVGDNWRLVEAVIDRVSDGQPAVLVGNSMGGLISVVTAAKRPAKVAALVLVDPALPRSQGARLGTMVAVAFLMISTPGLGHLVVDRRAALIGAERLVDEAFRLCTVDASRIDPATREAHVELTRWRQQQDGPYRAFIQASRSLVRWLWDRRTMEYFIRRVTAPTLLLHGDLDRVVELQAAQAAAALRPDWRFHVFEDTGHVPQMERPAEFLAVLGGWLDSAGGSVATGDDGATAHAPAAARPSATPRDGQPAAGPPTSRR